MGEIDSQVYLVHNLGNYEFSYNMHTISQSLALNAAALFDRLSLDTTWSSIPTPSSVSFCHQANPGLCHGCSISAGLPVQQLISSWSSCWTGHCSVGEQVPLVAQNMAPLICPSCPTIVSSTFASFLNVWSPFTMHHNDVINRDGSSNRRPLAVMMGITQLQK